MFNYNATIVQSIIDCSEDKQSKKDLFRRNCAGENIGNSRDYKYIIVSNHDRHIT